MPETETVTIEGCTVDAEYRVSLPAATCRERGIETGKMYDITLVDEMASFRSTVDNPNGSPRFRIPKRVYSMDSFAVGPGDKVSVAVEVPDG